MFDLDEKQDPWNGGVYLTTTSSTFEADILESKLKAENIPCIKRYRGPSNFLEITMGVSSAYPVSLYVPESALEKAKKVIEPVPIDDDFVEASAEDEE